MEIACLIGRHYLAEGGLGLDGELSADGEPGLPDGKLELDDESAPDNE
jgi:hypothetical protein